MPIPGGEPGAEEAAPAPTTGDGLTTHRAEGLRLRHPSAADGAAVWRLAGAAGGLDRNTPYAYLLLCDRFADTCILAEEGSRLLGSVMGLVPPRSPEAFFVWQVAVHPDGRGRRLGSRMLDALLAEHVDRGGGFLEATVTPSNHASLGLFRSAAKRWSAPCRESVAYRAEDFPGEAEHEDEVLLRIGPLMRPEDSHTNPERGRT